MPIFEPNIQTVAVSTSATQVFNPNATPFSTLAGPLKDVTIMNTGASTVFLGQSGVTATTGFPLGAGQQVTVNGFSTPAGSGGTAIYGICATSTSTTTVSGLATIDINE